MTRHRLLVCVSLVVLSLALASPAPAEIFVTGPSTKVLRAQKATPSATWDAPSKTVKLFGARNEFVSFQIVFSGAMKNVDVSKLVLTGPGGKLEHIAFFREHYIQQPVVSRYSARNVLWDCAAFDAMAEKQGGREFPVQMVPLEAKKEGAPFDVVAGKNEVVWCDVFIPEETNPGEYRGKLNTGGETLTVSLKVWNFTIPSVNHFPQFAQFSPEYIATAFARPQRDLAQMQPIVEQYFQIAHDHRMVLAEEWYDDEATLKKRGYYGCATGEAFKGPFGAGFGFEVIPIGADSGPKEFPLLQKQGWLNRAFVMTGDEPNDAASYQEVLSKGKAAKSATGGKLRTFITEQYEPSNASWPKLDEGIDIFCSSLIKPADIAAIDAKGKACWTYNSAYAGSCATDAPGVASRTNAWAGYVSGSRAWYFWDAIYVVDRQMAQNQRFKGKGRPWRDDPKPYLTDVWTNTLTLDESKKPVSAAGKLYGERDAIRINGDGNLIYAGGPVGIEGPIADFRMKGIRLGAQDFEYLYLLDKLGKSDVAKKEALGLLGPAKSLGGFSEDGQANELKYAYELDGEKWDAARIRLGTLLDQIGEQKIRAAVKPFNQYPNPVGHPDFYEGKRF
jgi:hypothetical protein